MRYLIEPRDCLLSFVKIMGTHLSNKYGQKFLDSAKNLKQI